MQNEKVKSTEQQQTQLEQSSEQPKGLISTTTGVVATVQDIEALFAKVNSLAQGLSRLIAKMEDVESSLVALGNSSTEVISSLHSRLIEVEKILQDFLPAKGLSFVTTPSGSRSASLPSTPETPTMSSSALANSLKPKF